MFQLVENASADGDVDYYRFFQECKKSKNLGRKQISTQGLDILGVRRSGVKMLLVTSAAQASLPWCSN